MTWHEQAACRLADAHLFDPVDRGEGSVSRVAVAKGICEGCPVKGECVAEAREHRDSGVRGGVMLDRGKPVREALPLPLRAARRAA